MYTFKFTLLAVLGYVTMIVASPVEDSPRYVPLMTPRGGSDPIGNISPAHSALFILGNGSAGTSVLSTVTTRIAWVTAPRTSGTQGARSVRRLAVLSSESARGSAITFLRSRPAGLRLDLLLRLSANSVSQLFLT
jgi:hypothetical protein